jgi:hypothetical protein
MVDTRANILARLLEIAATIPTIRTVHRNNVDITEHNQVPAAIVFDGDEEVTTNTTASRSTVPAPMLVEMTPEIVIAHIDAAADVDLRMLRRELVKRVLYDTELNQIVGTNGAIHYRGCRTDVGWMRSLHGALLALFVFKYTLKPWDL